MIPKEIFLERMALLAGRIGKELEPPVQREYYIQLSAELTTEQFVAAATLAFKTWPAEYKNWPSPQQIIELITPVSRPSITAAEAFEKVLAITNDPRIPLGDRLPQIQSIGAAALRAFRAAGGRREFENVLESQVVWLRKAFVEAYEAATENAEAERAANLALASASERVRHLTNSTADVLGTMPSKRITEKAS